MLQEDDVLPRATELPFLSALHAKNDTTNPFGYKLGESTENNKALLFFSDKATIQSRYSFHWSHYAVVCEMINFRVIWSVNEIVLFNGFLSDFVEITSCAYTNTTILFNLGSVALGIFTSISENNMHMHFLDLSGFIAYVVSQMYLKVPPPPAPQFHRSELDPCQHWNLFAS